MLGRKALLEIPESKNSKIICPLHVLQKLTEHRKHRLTIGDVRSSAFGYQSLVFENCQGLHRSLGENRIALTLSQKNVPRVWHLSYLTS